MKTAAFIVALVTGGLTLALALMWVALNSFPGLFGFVLCLWAYVAYRCYATRNDPVTPLLIRKSQ